MLVIVKGCNASTIFALVVMFFLCSPFFFESVVLFLINHPIQISLGVVVSYKYMTAPKIIFSVVHLSTYSNLDDASQMNIFVY